MANAPTSTADGAWHHLVATRRDLIAARSGSSLRDDEERVAAIEEQILESSAPDLAGLQLKLELLWAYQLDGEGGEARHRRMIVNDLRRLSA